MLTPPCPGAGSSVTQEILAHVTDMVEDGCRVCRRVQAEGIQVLSLITRDPHSLTEVATAQEREKWAAAVRVRTPLAFSQCMCAPPFAPVLNVLSKQFLWL